MTSILSILDELAADNSRLAKEKILLREKNNVLLQRVIKAALDPYINYWIKKIPEYFLIEHKISLSEAIDDLRYLADRTYTGNQGISHLRSLLSYCAPEDAIVIERIIGRNLECAVGEPSCNKTWPGLIPTFDVMLAHKDTSGIKYPAYAQVKSDGLRCHVNRTGDTITLWTRNGREIKINNVLYDDGMALIDDGETWDGELVCYNQTTGLPLERKTSNGIVNKGIKDKGMSVEESAMVRFICWDIVDFSSTIPYKNRLNEMFKRFSRLNGRPAKVIPIVSKEVKTEEEAIEFYNECILNGEEGSIEKNIESVWQPKRTKDLGKRKAEEEADLVIVGIKDGVGTSDKFKNLIGSLECQTSDGLCTVNVSGFDYNTRVDITNNPKKYLGKICTVKYNQLITDKKTGEYSLFLPRWVELRHDKNIANTLKELK